MSAAAWNTASTPCIATARETTHSKPVYEQHGVIHYAVGNIPGAVPNTATYALTNVTLPYMLDLANHGWREACRHDHALALGLNTHAGEITYKAVADAFDLPSVSLDSVLA